MTLQNEKFEELIGEHLKGTLEGQRGRALAAFREHIAREAENAPMPITRGLHKQVSRKALWFWTGVPSVAAAGLAVLVMLQLGVLGRQQNGGGTHGTTGGDSVVASSVEVTQQHTGGIVVSDNTPLREVREQKILQQQWFDPNENAVYTITQPTEKVNYIQVQPN